MEKQKKRVYIIIQFFDDDKRYRCIYLHNELEKEIYNEVVSKYPFLEAIAFCFGALKYPCEVMLVVPKRITSIVRKYIKNNENGMDSHYGNLALELYNQMQIHEVHIIAAERLIKLAEKWEE